MSDLKPCPFCGGEASVKVLEYDDDCKVWGVFCESDLANEYSHGHFVDNYATEAEAIAAWNSRAAMEFDNWFYLPKPKEPIVEVTETTHAWDGTKVKTDVFYQVQEQAVINWAKELGEHIIKRICEVWNSRADYHGYEQAAIEAWESIKAWNSRAERTCAMIPSFTKPATLDDCQEFCCSACGEYMVLQQFQGCADDVPNYCPNCGARRVDE